MFPLGICYVLGVSWIYLDINRGKNETKTSFIITAVGGISSAAGLGAIEGFSHALKTA